MSEELETQDQEQEQAAPLENAGAEESGDEGEQKSEESAASEGEHEEEQPKKKGGFQRKLDREVHKRTSAERERDFLREELHKALGTRKQETEQKEEVKASQPEPQPKLKDFDNWDEYFAANNEWMRKEAERIADSKLSAAEKRRQDQEQTRTKEAEDRRLTEAFNEREERASKKHKDWEDVAGDGDSPTVFVELTALNGTGKAPSVGVIAATLRDADPEGDLEYYLAKNLDEVERIAKLPQVQASLELGKLLGTKLAPPKSTAAKVPNDDEDDDMAVVSKAPPPPKIIGKATPTATGLSDDLSDDEWLKRRRAELRKASAKR